MSEGVIHYITLEPVYVQAAVNLYISSFKAKRIHDYNDNSTLLSIYDSNVIVTSGTPPSKNTVLELLLDRDSLQAIKQDPRFIESELESDLEKERCTVKLWGPFGVCWLLTEYKKDYSDLYPHIDSCEKEMSEIRNIRFVYESEDIVKFCETPLRAIFDELERVNSFRQSLAVTLLLNPTMCDLESLEEWMTSVEFYAPLVLEEIKIGSTVTSDLLVLRSSLADSFRQLVKRMQTGRTSRTSLKIKPTTDNQSRRVKQTLGILGQRIKNNPWKHNTCRLKAKT
ncbi:uncharacterized protein LOC130499746 isoform X2 [Raphanus sativus]|nr:uncharacterized protein LOC130499746 isoform X2 [Raphanus sativus]